MDDFSLQTSVRDLAFVLFKRKWSLLTVFTVASVAAAAYLFLIRDDIYQVSARVLVRIGHEQEPPATVMGERPMMIVGQRYQDVNSEADILSSVDLLGQLVDELGLDKAGPPASPPPGLVARVRYEAKAVVKQVKQATNKVLIKIGFRTELTPREEAIAMLQKGLLVTPQKDSNVLVVNLFLPSRQHGSAILNKLLERYQQFRLTLFLDRSIEDFFKAEVATRREALEAAERELHDFEREHGIISIQDQEQVLLKQLSDAQDALTAAEVAARIGAIKVGRLEQELKAPEPDFASLGAFDQTSFPESIMLQLAELQKQRELLRMTPVSESAMLENNRRQFGLLVDMIASNLRASQQETEKALERRRAAVAEIQARIDGLHARQMKWNELKRSAKVAETGFLFNQNKLQQAQASAAMERQRVGNVEIIEKAIDPFGAAGIRKLTLLAMCLGVAALAAFAYVAVLEFFDHRIYAARALETRMSAPVLGVVPVMKGRRRRHWTSGITGFAHRA